MTAFSRRQACLALAASLAALASPAAFASDASAFPSKPVTIMTAFAPGSGPDAVLRLVADKLSRDWSQRVLVENRPGGGGFIAIEAARRAAPDGYTLLQLDSEHLGALPHLYKSRNFVTLDHFDPVAILFRTPFFIAVPTDSELKTVGDLVAKARANPGKLSYGSWAVGSPGHLGGEQLQSLTGVKMEHVPYREVSQLYTNLSTGDLDWAYGTLPSTQSVYQTGKIRYIAIAAPERHPQQPDVPTVAEAGGPQGVYVNSFVSLVAPKGVPADIAARINASVAKAVADPEIQARYKTFAFETLNWSPEDIRKQAQVKYDQYGELVTKAGISLE
ncbi:tripartite tricarboxylate transporter substrate binding protein [Achromobacter sp. GG226]|uniref:Bug family tripartite tricarboxylate transporter substrate binding protein n=1 Tax=Verticiella alkaliphila TaxID=2779529 RepID=UPI001C0D854E|nr:tripartite tricarboxylate transporter substrate binding protein [Verticiella sp. GG226]MBU4610468.1 tripartite tricarboxylate transporter substrate binding protein [Verticiella sp. GG226]